MKRTLGLLLITFFTLAKPVLSQQTATPSATPISISISPVILDYALFPGEQEEFLVDVTNLGEEAVKLKPEILSFTAEDLTGGVKIIENSEFTDVLKQWLFFVDNVFELKPKERKNFRFMLTLPNNAAVGGHYGIVAFKTINEAQSVEGTGAALSGRIGTLLLLTVKGDIKRESRVLSFNIPSVYLRDQVPIQIGIKNLGTTHELLTGSVKIFNLFGNSVAELTLPPYILLPQKSRIYNLSWNNPWQAGFFKAQLSAKDLGGQEISSEVKFYHFPIRGVVFIVSVLLIIIFLLWFGFKKIKIAFPSPTKTDRL